jgi:hypothetical protein
LKNSLGISKTALWLIATLLWLPFLVCAIYNFPQHDDLYNYCWIQEQGLLNTNLLYLKNHDGRWLSNIVGQFFLQFKFLLTNYYLLFVLLQIVNVLFFKWGIQFFCRLYKIKTSNNWLLAIYLHLFFMLLMPETSTAYYWVSAAYGYHLATLFMMAYGLIFIEQIKAPNKITFVVLVLASLLLPGWHELVWAITTTVVAAFALYNVWNKRFLNWVLWLLAVLIIAGLTNFFINNSVGQAKAEYVQKSITYKVGHTFYQWLSFIIIVLKQPLLWVLGLSMFLIGNQSSFKILWQRYTINYVVVVLLAIPFAVIAIPHLYGIGVPNRVYNLLMYPFVTVLLGLAYIVGNNTTTTFVIPKKVIVIALLAGLLINTNLQQAIGSMFVGKVYKTLHNNRITKIDLTRQNGNTTVKLKTYKEAIKEYYSNHPSATNKLFQKFFEAQPTTQFFDDDFNYPTRISSFAEYYGIDSIAIDSLVVPRFGITKER